MAGVQTSSESKNKTKRKFIKCNMCNKLVAMDSYNTCDDQICNTVLCNKCTYQCVGGCGMNYCEYCIYTIDQYCKDCWMLDVDF